MKIKTFLLAAVTPLIASLLLAEAPVEITSGKMSLKFASDGKPKSFKIADKELLNEQNPGVGFELQGFAYNYGRPSTFAFKDLKYDGTNLVASIGQNVRVTLDVKKSDRYMAFKISRVEGIPIKNRLWLRFNMNVADSVKALPLDASTKVSAAGCDIRWPWLWMRSDKVPMGSFALYDAASESDTNALFLHICQSENVSKPSGFSGEWNADSAKQYFSETQSKWIDPNLAEVKPADNAGTEQGAEIIAEKVKLTFSNTGKPASLMIEDKEALNTSNPGAGFELNGYDFAEGKPITIPFTKLTAKGKELTVSNGGKAKIIFDVSATSRYVAFRMKSAEGFPQESLFWLQFKMNAAVKIKSIPLDYMCNVGGHGNSININWHWFWAKPTNNPLGGFAFYMPTSDEDEDETLLHLWANEGLPHSKVKGEWNIETARKWLADWQKQFADQSQMLITAKTNEDLYALADYATKMDIKRIYMHTDTWRGEYWPVKFSFLHLNPNTFPKGEEDFQKFAKYSREKGIGLTIHTVSCSIANHDPDYVVGKIDPRLAKWIKGTLDQSISETEKTIYFKPNPGEEMPLNIDRPVTGPSHVDPWNNINTICIDNEFIEVGQFTDTDKEVWVLKNCRRGHVKSTPAAHEGKAVTAGLIRPYGQVFATDNDSTLVEELGRRMAEFNNRNNIIHCEQDGGEVHTVNHQWGYAKFAQAVYTNLDHPVTSNNSGGSPMPCQLEYKFNSSRSAMRTSVRAGVANTNYTAQPTVPLTITRNGRPATTPYEMFSLVAKPMASGVKSIGIYKPEPMFGVSMEILQNQGLAPYAAEVVSTWKKAGPLLNDDQRKTILASSEHVIYRASNEKDRYVITPLHLLYRKGIDIGWKEGSEFGPVVPLQYTRTGSALDVENPYADQEPEFLIRVMNAFASDPGAVLSSSDKSSAANKDGSLIDSYNIGAGIKTSEGATASTDKPKTIKIDIQPLAEKIKNVGDHIFTQDGNAVRVQFENKRNETITNNEKLPTWDCLSDMTQARGIGLTVNGDGSGAVLVIQAHPRGTRDYVVVLDFKGERNIVIPCGEAAWSDARWGWRMDTKGSHYGELRRVSMAIGKVPPKTSVDIKVSNLRVLPEIPTEMANPIIKVGSGALEIVGKVSCETYLWYQGGDKVGVYDLNWKKTAELPVKKQNFIAPKGPLKISMECKAANPAPWLEWQFFVKDAPMVVEGK